MIKAVVAALIACLKPKNNLFTASRRNVHLSFGD